MTHLQLCKKIIGFVHGQDSHGDLLVPYQHDNCCPWCDRLTEFVEGLFLESNTFKNPLAKDAPINSPILNHERKCDEVLKLKHVGSIFDCPACKIQ